ncbi:manganese efflux pump [Mesobacillus maritimus]|uniref:manganese efflux pump n=1 Tax=Mesobacillus maritimus TaxID=1643336 RepID=UPI003D81953B
MRQIMKIGIMIGIFHVWMPLVGMIAGRSLKDEEFLKRTMCMNSKLQIYRSRRQIVIAKIG